jgi:glycosyltransferase involved in cell wall biosynthesis
VTVIIPAFNEADRSARGGGAPRRPWQEILVVDDGPPTARRNGRARRARDRHPYNKGNGAAVKSGIRAASGAFMLIMDGDGQHHAADALRLVGYLGEYDLVVGARSPNGQASTARRIGTAL